MDAANLETMKARISVETARVKQIRDSSKLCTDSSERRAPIIKSKFEVVGMEFKVTQKQLELLRAAAAKDPSGLANFTLIQNRNKELGEFRFMVVCEKVSE